MTVHVLIIDGELRAASKDKDVIDGLVEKNRCGKHEIHRRRI